jgi:hypothetical protein
MTIGHALRHEIYNKFRNKIDFYGRGINPINKKIDGLKDYMFSVVVENTKKDYYFTEKIIDCFMTGTIPIYWGCPSSSLFFDSIGVITFDDINDFEQNINKLSEDLYNKKIEAVKRNFEYAKKFLIAEDFIYNTYYNEIFKK